ncbi:Hypothetical protein NTJ_02369 [Nesidiocoris tenuis]|uniref:Uncharacterized protein n=1 Tax=Nesidiocoris tenuis TaxID=355587 RepID=A0ABN7AB77_9HEMI|nr:Hypothetical protein NTJ_02369 [Nesidiocoris tenuis]
MEPPLACNERGALEIALHPASPGRLATNRTKRLELCGQGPCVKLRIPSEKREIVFQNTSADLLQLRPFLLPDSNLDYRSFMLPPLKASFALIRFQYLLAMLVPVGSIP